MRPMNAPNRTKDSPGIVVPPPLVFAGFLAAGLVIDHFAVDVMLPIPEVFGAIFLVGAAVLLGDALFGFLKARTHPEPWKPSTVIVTRGAYRFTRNPMYLGMALAHAGIALALNSAVALATLVPAILIIRYGVIAREEAYLERKFGDGYRAYKARVRRWL